MNQIQFVQKESPLGSATESAHTGESPQPSCGFVRNLFELLKTNWVVVLIAARFSPDDKYSKERVLLKKRFGLLPIQGAPVKYWKGLASLVFFLFFCYWLCCLLMKLWNHHFTSPNSSELKSSLLSFVEKSIFIYFQWVSNIGNIKIKGYLYTRRK